MLRDKLFSMCRNESLHLFIFKMQAGLSTPAYPNPWHNPAKIPPDFVVNKFPWLAGPTYNFACLHRDKHLFFLRFIMNTERRCLHPQDLDVPHKRLKTHQRLDLGTETESEKLLQEMLYRQLDTNFSIKQLSTPIDFFYQQPLTPAFT